MKPQIAGARKRGRILNRRRRSRRALVRENERCSPRPHTSTPDPNSRPTLRPLVRRWRRTARQSRSSTWARDLRLEGESRPPTPAARQTYDRYFLRWSSRSTTTKTWPSYFGSTKPSLRRSSGSSVPTKKSICSPHSVALERWIFRFFTSCSACASNREESSRLMKHLA